MHRCGICAKEIELNQLVGSGRLATALERHKKGDCDADRCILKSYLDLMSELDRIEQEWKIACDNDDYEAVVNILARLKRYCPIVNRVHTSVRDVVAEEPHHGRIRSILRHRKNARE